MKYHQGIEAYRIVEVRGNDLYTLFHGLPDGAGRRSRKLPVDTWLEAEQRWVTDGSGTATYRSGFNVLLDLKAMKAYVGRFTKDRDLRIIKIKINPDLRVKEHSKADVYLADWMLIPKDWRKTSIKILTPSK